MDYIKEYEAIIRHHKAINPDRLFFKKLIDIYKSSLSGCDHEIMDGIALMLDEFGNEAAIKVLSEEIQNEPDEQIKREYGDWIGGIQLKLK